MSNEAKFARNSHWRIKKVSVGCTLLLGVLFMFFLKEYQQQPYQLLLQDKVSKKKKSSNMSKIPEKGQYKKKETSERKTNMSAESDALM